MFNIKKENLKFKIDKNYNDDLYPRIIKNIDKDELTIYYDEILKYIVAIGVDGNKWFLKAKNGKCGPAGPENSIILDNISGSVFDNVADGIYKCDQMVLSYDDYYNILYLE